MRKIALFVISVLASRYAQAEVADCSKADAKLAGGDLAAARALYQQALAAGQSPCAAEKLTMLDLRVVDAAGHLGRGIKLYQQSKLSEARAEFMKAVDLDPTSNDAMTRLNEINGFAPKPPPEESPVIRVRQLLRLGKQSEALTAINEALKSNPNLVFPPDITNQFYVYREPLLLKRAGFREEARTAIKTAVKSGLPLPLELEELGESTPHSWTVTKDWLVRWGEPLAGVAATILLIWIIVSLLRRRRQQRLVISDFVPAEQGLTTTPLYATNLSALIRDSLCHLAPAVPRYTIAAVTDPVGPVTIPDAVTSALPAGISVIAKLVPDIVQRVARGRVLQVDGRIHPPGSRGPGVTLVISGHTTKVDSVTIWQRDFDPAKFLPKAPPATDFVAADYYALAEPAAIWVLYTLDDRGGWL